MNKEQFNRENGIPLDSFEFECQKLQAKLTIYKVKFQICLEGLTAIKNSNDPMKIAEQTLKEVAEYENL